jgi:hypothetical protein
MSPNKVREYIKNNNIKEVTLYSLEELKKKYRYSDKEIGARGFVFDLDSGEYTVKFEGARIKVLDKKVKIKDLFENYCYVYGCFTRIPYEFVNINNKPNNLEW